MPHSRTCVCVCGYVEMGDGFTRPEGNALMFVFAEMRDSRFAERGGGASLEKGAEILMKRVCSLARLL